jgi:hypothetical protein
MERTGIRTRPIGVVIVAAVFVLGVGLNFVGAVDLLGLAGSASAVARSPIAVPLGWLLLIAAGLSVPTAYGIFAMTAWGWTLGVGMSVMAFVQNILQYLNDNSLLAGMVISAIVPTLILWYLFRPNVRAAFAGAS